MAKKVLKKQKQVEKQLMTVDAMVKKAGEKDVGTPLLALCPRCGSSDLHLRRIDIPGFAPNVQVCSRCGFRSESAIEVDPIEYVEEVGSGDGDEAPSRIEEIQKRVQSGAYGVGQKGGKKQGKETKQRGKKPTGKKPSAKPVKKPVAKKQKPGRKR